MPCENHILFSIFLLNLTLSHYIPTHKKKEYNREENLYKERISQPTYILNLNNGCDEEEVEKKYDN